MENVERIFTTTTQDLLSLETTKVLVVEATKRNMPKAKKTISVTHPASEKCDKMPARLTKTNIVEAIFFTSFVLATNTTFLAAACLS